MLKGLREWEYVPCSGRFDPAGIEENYFIITYSSKIYVEKKNPAANTTGLDGNYQ